MDFICPHCHVTQFVTPPKMDEASSFFDIGQTDIGLLGLTHLAIACSNADCKKLTLQVCVSSFERSFGDYIPNLNQTLLSERIYPRGTSMVLPEFVPAPIREDYEEACLIRDLSPKASATLIRRCIQGMIRDFCGIKKGRLIDEIKALRQAIDRGQGPAGVSLDSIDAIDAVREIGNIGAHMESDINHVVPVDPGEAQTLIALTESLLDDWYIARDKRQKRFASVNEIAASKKELIGGLKLLAADKPPLESSSM